MKAKSLSILICLTSILVSPVLASADSDCAERSIVASAVRTTGDVQAFVQCAYEFVQEVGFEEARRAFNEDANAGRAARGPSTRMNAGRAARPMSSTK